VCLVALVRWWRRADRSGGLAAARAFVDRHRPTLVVWAVVVIGWISLLSSSNIGTYFQLPLELLAVAAVVDLAVRLGGRIPRRLGPWAVAVAAVNLALISHWQIGASVPMGGGTLSLNAFGGVETSQAIDFTSGDPRFGPTRSTVVRQQAMAEWAGAANEVAAAVDDLTPRGESVVQTFVGDVRLFQATTLQLAEELTGRGRSPWEAPNAKSAVGDGSVSLAPKVGKRRRILVAVLAKRRISQEGYPPEPIIRRARRLGWTVAASVPLPDGGKVDLMVPPGRPSGG
jgi:hypothetical protein